MVIAQFKDEEAEKRRARENEGKSVREPWQMSQRQHEEAVVS